MRLLRKTPTIAGCLAGSPKRTGTLTKQNRRLPARRSLCV
jgi:hypothetical protein